MGEFWGGDRHTHKDTHRHTQTHRQTYTQINTMTRPGLKHSNLTNEELPQRVLLKFFSYFSSNKKSLNK